MSSFDGVESFMLAARYKLGDMVSFCSEWGYLETNMTGDEDSHAQFSNSDGVDQVFA
jgi:hypothetical protein